MPSVDVELQDSCAWVTLNNPERKNAVTAEMYEELSGIFCDLDDNGLIRAVVLRGAGEEAFCSGADLGSVPDEVDMAEASAIGTRSGLPEIRKPLLAMIQGYCLGGGLLLALCADIRIASDDSQFGIPAAKLGAAYPYPAIRRLVEVVGSSIASEILLMGERISSDTAARWNLVQRVVPKAQLETTMAATIEVILNGAPLTHLASKSSIRTAVTGSNEQDVAECEELIQTCWSSSDFSEGRQAFSERRAPQFRGK